MKAAGKESNGLDLHGSPENNPFFVKESANPMDKTSDFHLKEGSPASGTGHALPEDVAKTLGVNANVAVDRGALVNVAWGGGATPGAGDNAGNGGDNGGNAGNGGNNNGGDANNGGGAGDNGGNGGSQPSATAAPQDGNGSTAGGGATGTAGQGSESTNPSSSKAGAGQKNSSVVKPGANAEAGQGKGAADAAAAGFR